MTKCLCSRVTTIACTAESLITPAAQSHFAVCNATKAKKGKDAAIQVTHPSRCSLQQMYVYNVRNEILAMDERTSEGKDGADRAASGQEVGHVAPPGVHKDG